MKDIALFTGIIALGLLSAHADTGTVSGAGLGTLRYNPNSAGIAQYVAAVPGTPAYAELSTTDSGLNGDSPAVYVKAGDVGLASLGTLNIFSASYDLLGSPTGPAGTEPYFLTYLNAPGGGHIGVIGGGPDLNSSTPIHVIYAGAAGSDTYWGDTMAQLDNIDYSPGVTFGDMSVYETLVEIGDWDNGTAVIPASADIESITVSTPDVTSTLLLSGLALAGLSGMKRFFRA